VGGTGLYVDSVADGYVLSNKMPDLSYRAKLEEMSTEALYRMLMEQRPDCDVERRNRNRVMRLLEKLHDGDDVIPSKKPRYEVLRLGVTWPREILCQRIDERMTRRFAEGMLEEVQALLDDGVSPTFLLKLGLEYRIITEYLTGVIDSREELENLLGTSIKQFAKRQMTWFRRNADIHWLDMAADPVTEACALIDRFLENRN
jgi:tRNA dimethylallyltransferase